jgi:hypothetical protein
MPPKKKVNSEIPNDNQLESVIINIKDKLDILDKKHRTLERKHSLNEDMLIAKMEEIAQKEKEIEIWKNKKNAKRYCCCYKLRFSKRIEEAILEIDDLSKLEKIILRRRYIKMIEDIEKETKHLSFTYNLFKFLIQTGSLIIPAILSIQHFYPSDLMANPLYWGSWGTSIGVGLLTNYVGVFKIDQKFYQINGLLEKLKIEGWCYIELSGKYNKKEGDEHATHSNKFRLFCNEIENMKRKHIEIEFTPQNKTDNTNDKPSTGKSLLRGTGSIQLDDKIKIMLQRKEELIIKLKNAKTQETKNAINSKINALNKLIKKNKN